MHGQLKSSVVKKLIKLDRTGDPIVLVLLTYLGAAFHASLFDGVRTFMAPHQEEIRKLLNGPPSNAKLQEPDLRIVQSVSHQLVLVYRIAIFDSLLNSLTSYALAMRPEKAIGNAQMQASMLLGKTRPELVNGYIARRTKSLSRENIPTRIQALREITNVDFQLRRADFDELRRLANVRNAIIHEGSAFQFTVDAKMRVRAKAEAQSVKMGDDRLDVINRVAAVIYESYVKEFVGRSIHQVETIALAALNPRDDEPEEITQFLLQFPSPDRS